MEPPLRICNSIFNYSRTFLLQCWFDVQVRNPIIQEFARNENVQEVIHAKFLSFCGNPSRLRFDNYDSLRTLSPRFSRTDNAFVVKGLQITNNIE